MLTLCNVKTHTNNRKNFSFENNQTIDISGTHLTAIPALIDPHVHFRTPGAEHKENWISGAKAALSGGVTTVFDMPNNTPSCTSLERLDDKIQQIESQLKKANIPLRYHLYFGAHKNCISQLEKVKDKVYSRDINNKD